MGKAIEQASKVRWPIDARRREGKRHLSWGRGGLIQGLQTDHVYDYYHALEALLHVGKAWLKPHRQRRWEEEDMREEGLLIGWSFPWKLVSSSSSLRMSKSYPFLQLEALFYTKRVPLICAWPNLVHSPHSHSWIVLFKRCLAFMSISKRPYE